MGKRKNNRKKMEKRKTLRGGKMKNRCTKENEKNMECKKIEFKKRQKTGKKKKDKSKKTQATEREENEVENEKREDGKSTREEIS